ncbi:unnamed protein product [Malus baccata var. baccata]
MIRLTLLPSNFAGFDICLIRCSSSIKAIRGCLRVAANKGRVVCTKKMEKEKERANRIHILVVPLPVQGHVNPMLQFSKRLAAKGLRVTLVTISSNTEAIETQLCKVKIEPIHATSEEEEEAGNNVENKVLWFQTILSRRLPQLILKQENDGYPIICLVYDSAMPWVLDTAKGLGIFGASFFTHSCAVGAVYYNVHEGLLRVPLKEPTISVPGLPLLEPQDLPSFIYDPGSYPSFLNLVVSRFSNISGADWIFFNTFHGLEKEVVNWMRTRWPIMTIGPTLPSMYLDKRLEDDKDYGFSIFNSNTEACKKWLESKETGTVVYVSFGSMANLGEKQMEEIALGLKRSNANFLWVVRESETQKLPSNFEEQTSEKGLVVNWCPQLEVLGHRALGCFMTHCGWNSTLEALSSGVPMVAMPQWTDQTTNAKFVEDEWKVGVRVKVDQMGIVTKEEIERCIAEFHGVRAQCLNIRAGMEIPDKKLLKYALQYIRGIGRARAGLIISQLNMTNKLAEDLTRREVAAIGEEISNYLVGRELAIVVEGDIKRMKDTGITYFIVKTKRNDIPEMYPTINIEAVKDLHVLICNRNSNTRGQGATHLEEAHAEICIHKLVLSLRVEIHTRIRLSHKKVFSLFSSPFEYFSYHGKRREAVIQSDSSSTSSLRTAHIRPSLQHRKRPLGDNSQLCQEIQSGEGQDCWLQRRHSNGNIQKWTSHRTSFIRKTDHGRRTNPSSFVCFSRKTCTMGRGQAV